MTIPNPEECEKTLVDQLPPEREDHSTWPAPPLSPISSNPPPELVDLPAALRAPALPYGLVEAQLQKEDDSSE